MSKLETLLAEMKDRAEKAHREICDIAQGKRKWEMCIPVQATDSDMVLQAPLDDMEILHAVIEMLIEQRDRLALFSPAPPTIAKDEMNQEIAQLIEELRK